MITAQTTDQSLGLRREGTSCDFVPVERAPLVRRIAGAACTCLPLQPLLTCVTDRVHALPCVRSSSPLPCFRTELIQRPAASQRKASPASPSWSSIQALFNVRITALAVDFMWRIPLKTVPCYRGACTSTPARRGAVRSSLPPHCLPFLKFHELLLWWFLWPPRWTPNALALDMPC